VEGERRERNMKAPPQYINLWEWNVLIILDACRSDYFEYLCNMWGRFTELEVESCDTLTWLTMNFPDKYPYVYVSGNPYCNSKIKVGDFLGGEHFKKVIDAWKWGWDERLMTVPPSRVTMFALPYICKERTIVHYMQPHFPSVGRTKVTFEAWRPDPLDTVVEGKTYPRSLPPASQVREAYIENLRIVLDEVKFNLLPKIPMDRKVVITSDHGELLGEYGYFFHPVTDDLRVKRILGRVFWFEVER